jgi:uncharacterized protein
LPTISVMVKPVSGQCNMRCSYCFYADEMKRREVPVYRPMSMETLDNLIRRVFAYADHSVSIAFQGGEPTLAGAGFYRELFRLERMYNTRRLPVTHAIQTNGYALTDDLLGVLKEGRFLVGVSVDGTQTLHDEKRRDALGQPTWARVTANIEKLRLAGLPYNILCVVDQRVAQAANEVFETLRPHGYLQFIPCLDGLAGSRSPDSLTAEAYGRFLIDVFAPYARGFREDRFVSVRMFDNWVNMLAGVPPENCGFLGRCSRQFLVESNGNVYPCDFFALDEWLLGNVNRTSLLRLAKAETALRFLDSSMAVDERCRGCRWAFLCRGGCRRDREPVVDGVLRLNRLCEGLCAFFNACYPEMEELSKLPPPKMPVQR